MTGKKQKNAYGNAEKKPQAGPYNNYQAPAPTATHFSLSRTMHVYLSKSRAVEGDWLEGKPLGGSPSRFSRAQNFLNSSEGL